MLNEDADCLAFFVAGAQTRTLEENIRIWIPCEQRGCTRVAADETDQSVTDHRRNGKIASPILRPSHGRKHRANAHYLLGALGDGVVAEHLMIAIDPDAANHNGDHNSNHSADTRPTMRGYRGRDERDQSENRY